MPKEGKFIVDIWCSAYQVFKNNNYSFVYSYYSIMFIYWMLNRSIEHAANKFHIAPITHSSARWPNSMMTSSNVCGEFTGHQWIPRTKASDWWGWWFETPSCSLWRNCNGMKKPTQINLFYIPTRLQTKNLSRHVYLIKHAIWYCLTHQGQTMHIYASVN